MLHINIKQLAVIFMSTLCFISAKAQVGESRRDFSIGGSVGYSLNRMDFQPRIKQDWKGDMYFGFAARYICEKYFKTIAGLQVEVNYVNLGWKELIEDGSGNQYQRHFPSIQIPLLMEMGWGRERKGFKFNFEAGPQLGVLLDSREVYGGETWDTSHRPNGVNYQYGMSPDRRFDYGIAAGLGVEWSSVIGHFILGGRFYYGLGDTFDNSKSGKFGRSCNMTIQVKLTYLFDIIKTKGEGIK